LLSALIDATSLTESKSTTIYIESAINFTTEIKRIGAVLWPSHTESITSYSIRHQIASNFKKYFSSDDVSKALGHASSKTKNLMVQQAKVRGAHRIFQSAHREKLANRA
jgi:integrase